MAKKVTVLKTLNDILPTPEGRLLIAAIQTFQDILANKTPEEIIEYLNIKSEEQTT